MPFFCPACGTESEYIEICHYHHEIDDNWSKGNRVICDLIHRGKEPTRLSEEERRDEYFTSAG